MRMRILIDADPDADPGYQTIRIRMRIRIPNNGSELFFAIIRIRKYSLRIRTRESLNPNYLRIMIPINQGYGHFCGYWKIMFQKGKVVSHLIISTTNKKYWPSLLVFLLVLRIVRIRNKILTSDIQRDPDQLGQLFTDPAGSGMLPYFFLFSFLWIYSSYIST